MPSFEQIKETVEGLLEKMGVTFEEVSVKEEKFLGQPSINIKTRESHALIGHKGENLSALNLIVRKLMAKKMEVDDIKISADVNNYREEIIENIKIKALMMAERAKSFKSEVEMEPMSSFERMVVHSVLSEKAGIETQSKGERAERRVVIKYTENYYPEGQN